MLKHADYPHTPGMLYDCELCESTCFCGPDNDGPCVHCALVQSAVQESEELATQYDWDAWYSQDS